MQTGAIALAVLFAGGIAWLLNSARRARAEASRALEEARRIAAQVRAKSLADLAGILAHRRAEWEAEQRALRATAIEREGRLTRLLERVEERELALTEREGRLGEAVRALDARTATFPHLGSQARQLREEQKQALLADVGMTAEEARQAWLRELEATVRHEAEVRCNRELRELEEEAEFHARSVLQTVLNRIRTRQTLEPQHNVIRPKQDTVDRWFKRAPELKDKLQELTGVEITSEPEGEIRFSAYDGVSREVAKMAFLESDRRPNLTAEALPAFVQEQEAILTKALSKIARRFLEGMRLRDIHPDIVKAMGRLRFRTSYGQNILEHSCEAGFIAAHLAAEVGLEPRLAMRCGLLHDLGKALTTAEGGMHDDLGAELAKRCGEHEFVVDAIEGHHHDNASVYTRLAMSGDAISGARPGARRETYEKYVERIEQLTAIAGSFPEVQGVATMKAGREVRVHTQPQGLSDQDVIGLAERIAKQIEEKVIFPGEIHVTAIKETKVVEYAR